MTGGLSENIFKVKTTDVVKVLIKKESPRLAFACLSSSEVVSSLVIFGIKGTLGLGRSQFSFPAQLASAFRLPRKYAICVPSWSEGYVFIGGGPYEMLPLTVDLSTSLVKTHLIVNPVAGEDEFGGVGDPSEEYFIGVKSVKIDGRVVHFNASLLSINPQTGVGGTNISIMAPYAILHSSIYKAFVYDFVERAASREITRVAAVKPFGACFSAKGVHWTRAGPRVPTIDLELEGGNARSVNRRIYGANSMVRVNKNVMCLGFVDGGSQPRTSIVIGGLQLEDNLLEFDLTNSKLGFTSSLLVKNTSCSYSRLF